jgi:exoribonuclease R
LLQDINASLPPGIESHRAYRYLLPLDNQMLDLIVLQVHAPEALEHKLTEWRRTIEERHPLATILINRVQVSQSLESQIRHRFPATSRLTREAIPAIRQMIADLCGSPPKTPIACRSEPPARKDFTSIPFIAIDRPTTIDREDLIHGEKKHGYYILRVAINDITDFIQPGSEHDRYGRRVGHTTYGRTRAVSPIGQTLFGGQGSFVLNEVRAAWVMEMKISFNPQEQDEYQIRRAWVKNHCNIDPSVPFRESSAHERAKNIAALAEITRILEHRRKVRSPLIRIEGDGVMSRIVAEAMIQAKRLFATFMVEDAKIPGIFRVHQKPSDRDIETFLSVLNELRIPATVESLRSMKEVAFILRSLEEHSSHKARSLSNRILDTFLIHSQYSATPGEHYGLRLPYYAEWKARDYSGIVNQQQLDAYFRKASVLQPQEVAERATALNDREWSRGERYYKLNALESLEAHLLQVDATALGVVVQQSAHGWLVEVGGFSKWGVVLGTSTMSAISGDILALRLVGYNQDLRRYEFALTMMDEAR